jgi:hypothetical protein
VASPINGRRDQTAGASETKLDAGRC